MKRWERTISISAPIDRVFAYVSDFGRHGEWSSHDLQVSRTDSGPVGVGTTFSTVAKQFGTQREQSTVTEMAPPHGFGWDSVGALGRVHHRFSLQEASGATTLTKAAELVEPKLLARITMFNLSRDIPKGLESDLSKIKAAMEAQAT